MTVIRILPLSLATIQLVVTLLLAVAFSAFGTAQQALSCLSGGLLIWINWHFLGWSWWRILTKKSIALGASVIVLKYAILGIALIVVVRQPWLEILPLVVGISGLIPTILLYAILQKTGS